MYFFRLILNNLRKSCPTIFFYCLKVASSATISVPILQYILKDTILYISRLQIAQVLDCEQRCQLSMRIGPKVSDLVIIWLATWTQVDPN